MDLHTSSINQMIAYEVVSQEGFLKNHVRRIRKVYRERRDVMIQAMREFFPENVQWTEPEGGLFLWVTLPESLDSEALLPQAVANKVAFVPGHVFYPDGRGRNTMRLNFSNAQPAQTETGIRRLGEVLHDAIEEMEMGEFALA